MKKIVQSLLTDPSLTLEQALERSGTFTLYGFGSRAEAEAFAASLPKFVRARAVTMSGQVREGEATSGELYGFTTNVLEESRLTFRDGPFKGVTVYKTRTFGVAINVSTLNATTGRANEAGQRRIRRFMQAALPLVEEADAGARMLEAGTDEWRAAVGADVEEAD